MLRAFLPLLRALCALFFLLAPPAQGAAQFVFFGRNQFEAPAAAAVPVVPAAQTPAEAAGLQTAREGKALSGESSGNGLAPDGSAGLETIFFGQVKRNPKNSTTTSAPPPQETVTVASASLPTEASIPVTAAAIVTPSPVRKVDDTIFFGQVTRPLRPDPTPPAPPVFETSSPPTVPTPLAVPSPTSPSASGVADTIFFGQVTRPPRPATQPAGLTADIVATATSSALPVTVPPTVTAQSAGRGTAAAKHTWEGRNYYLSWRTGQNNFEWSAGAAFCNSLGMRLVSLDSPGKLTHFLELVAAERPLYFWAGGELEATAEKLRWLSGSEEAVVRGAHPWSAAGKSGAPQPDGAGTERCLAVQNNLFR